MNHNVSETFCSLFSKLKTFCVVRCSCLSKVRRAFDLVLNCSGCVRIELLNLKLHAIHSLLQKEISNPTHCKNTEMQVSLSLILKDIWDQINKINKSKNNEVESDLEA